MELQPLLRIREEGVDQVGGLVLLEDRAGSPHGPTLIQRAGVVWISSQPQRPVPPRSNHAPLVGDRGLDGGHQTFPTPGV